MMVFIYFRKAECLFAIHAIKGKKQAIVTFPMSMWDPVLKNILAAFLLEIS